MKRVPILISLLVFALSPSAFGSNEASCRQLLVSQVEPYPEPDEIAAYHADAEKAYRDCRGPELPLDVRVTAMTKFAASQNLRGYLQSATEALGEAIAIIDRVPGDQTRTLIDLLDLAAMTESNAHLATDAVAHAERALSLRMRAFGNYSLEAVDGMVKLGIVHATFGEYAKSESVLRSAIAIAEAACGPECDALSNAYSGMYALYSSQGNEKEARRYDEMALNARPPEKRDSRSRN